MAEPEDPTPLNEMLRGRSPQTPPASLGEVLDAKLLEQERTTSELEARVKQLELIALAHRQIPHDGDTGRPDAPQAS